MSSTKLSYYIFRLISTAIRKMADYFSADMQSAIALISAPFTAYAISGDQIEKTELKNIRILDRFYRGSRAHIRADHTQGHGALCSRCRKAATDAAGNRLSHRVDNFICAHGHRRGAGAVVR